MTYLLTVLFVIVFQLTTINCQTQAPNQCKVKASCEPLQYSECFGISLSYTQTSLIFANDSRNQSQANENLKLWSGLKAVPACWSVIQPLLCAIYMPRCNDSYVDVPSKELCSLTRGPCRIVDKTQGWPPFLQCDHDHYVEKCKNVFDQAKFNVSSSVCESPLVSTTNEASWYEDVDGCGIQCHNPIFSEDEHNQVHIFVAIVGAICLTCTLFTLLTFIVDFYIDWRNATRYPALIIFFINICFFVGSIGWLAQFSPGARDDITCKRDGTMRRSEPQIGSGETLSCTIIFILVYYSMMAAVSWFAVLAYSWHLYFRAIGSPGNSMEGKVAYFHMFAWVMPLVLTIICLAISEVDGDSLSGICFVGYFNHVARGLLLLGPIAVVIIVGLFFLIKGLRTLLIMRRESALILKSDRASAKIRETILRIGIFAVLAMILLVVTFIVHLYIFAMENEWKRSFEQHLVCQTNTRLGQSSQDCTMDSRPSIVAIQAHIFAYFAAGIAMSSWVWNKSTADVWRRFYKRIFNIPENKPIKLRKHKMIAQAFAKRHQPLNNGRMSISFCSTHDDPLGMKFDLNNSVESNEMSSAWVQAMPKLVRRRGGMAHPMAGTNRRYSDSDIQSVKSFTHRRVSVESQRSMIEAELEARHKKKKLKKKHHRSKKGKILPIMPPETGSRRGSQTSRRGSYPRRASDTSLISRASAQSVALGIEKEETEDHITVTIHRRNNRDRSRAIRPGTGKVPTVNNNVPLNTMSRKKRADLSMFTASNYVSKPCAVNDSLEVEDIETADEEAPMYRGNTRGPSGLLAVNAEQLQHLMALHQHTLDKAKLGQYPNNDEDSSS
uniref:Smoothened n=1 Tax=Terebratalia transversa TaxID=34513 RepID=A0A0U2VGE5_TERTR|nr:smoothened [Terebratalia transversa]